MTSKLQRELEDLYGLERRTHKFDLAGTRALLAALGDPHRRFRAVHVAGTNGKGTTCALVERILREAGVVTGLFTSPHLVDFRERIRVGGRWVDEDWLEGRLAAYRSIPEAQGRTFFEITTALGFEWFAAREVAWAVVETGLGGRLDCTNVLEPGVCAITSIGLDHTEILGGTLEEIAAEKAGILKAGIPAVVGPLEPGARDVIARHADLVGAPLFEVAGAGPLTDSSFKDLNRAVAEAIVGQLQAQGVNVSAEALRRGLESARWPGRLEASPRESRLLWDGAHNPAGARALAGLVRERGVESIVLALSRDKDPAAMLDALGPAFATGVERRLIATRYASERAHDPATLVEAALALGWTAEPAGTLDGACRRALASTRGAVLLTGSLFAVGEAMAVFGGAPGEWQ